MPGRACVIGFGASGIAAVRQLQQAGLDVICYEGRAVSSGVWLHDDTSDIQLSFDDEGRPIAMSEKEKESGESWNCSAIYDNLHTNVPSPTMSYRGRPFPRQHTIFPHHTVVTEYLQQAGSEFQHLVKFRHLVKRMRHSPADRNKSGRWLLEVGDLDSGGVFEEFFDFVMIATGHYSVPHIPFCDGLWRWQRSVTHSRAYRRPSAFSGKNVMIVGANPSGADIAREIATFLYENDRHSRTPKVYQSVRDEALMFARVSGDPASIVHIVPTISSFSETTITLSDGSFLKDVDVVLFATGYLLTFPFCQPHDAPWSDKPLIQKPPIATSSPVTTERPRDVFPNAGLVAHNLDRNNLFYFSDPTVAFLALQYRVLPFPLAEVQARAVAARWTRKSNFEIFPGLDENAENGMADELEIKKTIVLGQSEFDYQDNLIGMIGEGGEGNDLNPDGTFTKTPAWRKGMRAAAVELKLAVLGH